MPDLWLTMDRVEMCLAAHGQPLRVRRNIAHASAMDGCYVLPIAGRVDWHADGLAVHMRQSTGLRVDSRLAPSGDTIIVLGE